MLKEIIFKAFFFFLIKRPGYKQKLLEDSFQWRFSYLNNIVIEEENKR